MLERFLLCTKRLRGLVFTGRRIRVFAPRPQVLPKGRGALLKLLRNQPAGAAPLAKRWHRHLQNPRPNKGAGAQAKAE